jgi:hypothetical protein
LGIWDGYTLLLSQAKFTLGNPVLVSPGGLGAKTEGLQ